MRAHQNTRLRTLDNLSLLFAPGSSDGKDAVAVTARVENNGINFEIIHEAAEEGLLGASETLTSRK